MTQHEDKKDKQEQQEQHDGILIIVDVQKEFEKFIQNNLW